MRAAGEYEQVSIDLDLVRPAAPDRPSRPLWSPSRRRLAIGVAVVLATSILAADTAHDVERATSVPLGVSLPITMPASGQPLAVIGDSLYTTTDDGSRLDAYSLRTGRRRWSVATPKISEPDLLDAGSRLLLTARQQNGQTVAIDAGTGVVGWQRPGTPIWLAPAGDRVAIGVYEPSTDPAAPDRTVVAVVDVANGAQSAVFGPVGPKLSMSPVFSTDAGTHGLTGMFVREDPNHGQLFDFAGARVRRFDLPLPATPELYGAGDQPLYEMVFTAGDLTLDASDSGGRHVLARYSGDPPRHRWTVTDLPVFGLWRCGEALCGSYDNQSLALDPGTGEVRWRSAGGLLWRASEHRVYSSAQVGRDGTTGIAVLDETTGRQLLRQDPWRPVTQVEGPRIPILAQTRTGQVLAVLDARQLRTDRLALLPHGGGDCWAGKTYVTCRIGTDTFRAWRYSS